MIISEQLAVYGNVDFPPTDQNMASVISLLAPLGYLPNTVQEVSPDGSMTFRMALSNMKDAQIMFGANKIQIIRSARPDSQDGLGFVGFALGILEKINSVRILNLTRIGLIRDSFLPELSSSQMDESFVNLFGRTESAIPFEWSFRTTTRCKIESDNDLAVVEIGRSQGTINDNGRLSDFDRLRLSVDVGTDIDNKTPRYDYLKAKDIVTLLVGKIAEHEAAMESKIYGKH